MASSREWFELVAEAQRRARPDDLIVPPGFTRSLGLGRRERDPGQNGHLPRDELIIRWLFGPWGPRYLPDDQPADPSPDRPVAIGAATTRIRPARSARPPAARAATPAA
jgi:hypothetical protein